MANTSIKPEGFDSWTLGKAIADAWSKFDAASTTEARRRVMHTLSKQELAQLNLSPEEIKRLNAA